MSELQFFGMLLLLGVAGGVGILLYHLRPRRRKHPPKHSGRRVKRRRHRRE